MDEPDDTIDHDDTIVKVTPYDKEPNPEKIQWGFIKTGKATGDGIVHTHNRNFKYHKRDHNHAQDIWYYTCSFNKKTKCPCTVVIHVVYEDDDKGEPVRKLKMVSCPTPDAHALFHTPAPEKVIVSEIMVLMKNAVEADPNAKVGEYIFCFQQRLGLSLSIIRPDC